MSSTPTVTRPTSGPAVRPGVVGASDRFAQRPMVERRRRWVRRGLLAALVLAFAAAAWVLGWSQLMGVRTVEVVGAQRAPDDLVVLTAHVEPGTPLARVDTGEVARRVGELRVVGSVDVQRVWPHTLRITVHERSAVAAARRGDSLRLIDASGVDYAVTKTVPRGRPLLDVDLDRASPERVAAGLAVLDSLPPALGRRVQSISVISPDDVRLLLRTGSVVLWGDPGEAAHKADVLAALLPQKAERYDVRAPDAPTTKG